MVDRTVVAVTAKVGIPPDPSDVLLMNYDLVDKFREDLDERGPFDALICDKAHYLQEWPRATYSGYPWQYRLQKQNDGNECDSQMVPHKLARTQQPD